MKTMTRLLAAATLCALPATADATVTYKVTSGTNVLVSFSTVIPITGRYDLSDFDGQTCSLRNSRGTAFYCTNFSLELLWDAEIGKSDTRLTVGTELSNNFFYYSGNALFNNGSYTDRNFTLSVSGIGDIMTPGTAAVPELATWALMLAGFGLTGAALRRRRVRFAGVAA